MAEGEAVQRTLDLMARRSYNTEGIVLQHERLIDAIVMYAKSIGLEAPVDSGRSSLEIRTDKYTTMFGDTLYTAILDFGGIPEEDLDEPNNSK